MPTAAFVYSPGPIHNAILQRPDLSDTLVRQVRGASGLLRVNFERWLRKEYREHSQKSLEKCFSYLNFYVGLLAALLAATLTGLLQVQPGDARAWLLLIGPAAALALALLGYKTFVVFYRRFVEAWVTEINLQSMLGEHLQEPDSIGQPLVRSKSGGWIAKFERPRSRRRSAPRPMLSRCSST